MRFNSAELALSIDELSKRYIEPAVKTLVSGIEADYLAYATKKVYNVVGTAGTAITTLATPGLARARLNQMLAPKDNNRAIQMDSNHALAEFLAKRYKVSQDVTLELVEIAHAEGGEPGKFLDCLDGQFLKQNLAVEFDKRCFRVRILSGDGGLEFFGEGIDRIDVKRHAGRRGMTAKTLESR